MKRRIEKLMAYSGRLQALQIPVHAAHASFFLVLSLFPMLVLVLGLLRYTGLQVSDLLDLADAVLPGGLMPFVGKLLDTTYSHTSPLVVSVSALTALWSAGRGIFALKVGLDAISGVREQRLWLVTRLLCAFYTLLFLLVVLLTLVLHVFSGTLLQWLRREGSLVRSLANVVDMRIFLLEAVQIFSFCAIYMVLPGQRRGFRESLPGALFTCVGWLAVSWLFSLYMDFFPRYFSIFGSVYAVAVGMLWLYTCVSILFYGAELNHLLSGKNP